MKNGAVYTYRAIVRIPVSHTSAFTGLRTKAGYMSGDLVTSLQADLAMRGLIVTQYKVTGKTPNYGLSLELVPAKSFFSTQSVKQIVDQAIQQETGFAPAWSEDPALMPSPCICPCSPCYCVRAATLAMISPQGVNAFAPGGSGANVVAKAPTDLAGAAYGAVDTAYTDTRNALNRGLCDLKKGLTTTIIAVVAIGLLALYVFGKAGGSIG